MMRANRIAAHAIDDDNIVVVVVYFIAAMQQRHRCQWWHQNRCLPPPNTLAGTPRTRQTGFDNPKHAPHIPTDVQVVRTRPYRPDQPLPTPTPPTSPATPMSPRAISETNRMIGLTYPREYRRREGDGGREGEVERRGRRVYEGTRPTVNPTPRNACPTPWARKRMGNTTPDDSEDTAAVIGTQTMRQMTCHQYVASPHPYLHPHLYCARTLRDTIIPYPTHPKSSIDALAASQFALAYRSLLRGEGFGNPGIQFGR
jgi:hypothetical protein